jgi:hypothetical protein
MKPASVKPVGRWAAVIGSLLIAIVVAGMVVLASYERSVSLQAVLQQAAYCGVVSDVCSLTLATWSLALISACAFVAAVVAAIYTARAASETRHLALHTSATAEETKRLANAGDRLAVGITNCATPQQHSAFVPAAELWVTDSFELVKSRPASNDSERLALFEAVQFGPVGILNFQMRATIFMLHGDREKEMGSCVVSLGDIGPTPCHFSFACPEQMALTNVRVAFSEGKSLIDPSGSGDPVVHLSRARHQLHVLARVASRG